MYQLMNHVEENCVQYAWVDTIVEWLTGEAGFGREGGSIESD